MALTIEAKVNCDCEGCEESGPGRLVYTGVAASPEFLGIFGMVGGGGGMHTLVPLAWVAFCGSDGFFCSQACRDKTLTKRREEADAKREKAVDEIIKKHRMRS